MNNQEKFLFLDLIECIEEINSKNGKVTVEFYYHYKMKVKIYKDFLPISYRIFKINEKELQEAKRHVIKESTQIRMTLGEV